MKNLKIQNQKFFNTRAILVFFLLQIIAILAFVNKEKNIELNFFKTNDFGTYVSTENPKVLATPVNDTSSIKENKKEVAIEPVKVVEIVPIVKTVQVVKVVPIKKVVVKKRKIEIIAINSIPVLSVSSSVSNNEYLTSDTFVKQNEIISEAIEIIDSIEVTENDTITKDSTYYVMDIRTVAKSEEPLKIGTNATNPNTKIVPIKWNGKKIVANKKGNWNLTNGIQNETTDKKEATYGNHYSFLPGEHNDKTSDNMEDNTDIKNNANSHCDVHMNCIKSPPPIYNKWHWEENSNLLLFYQHQQLLE